MKTIKQKFVLLSAFVLCGFATSSHVAQSQQDTKLAAKKAIKAFFNKGAKAQSGLNATLLANLSDTRINESSGLVASRRNANVFWTHNDSGDGPYLFAIDRAGNTLARFTLPNATNVDWEDIAIGPGANGKLALYVGDIGDNNHNRTDTCLYRIPEPKVDTSQTLQEAQTAAPEKFPYRYPDGSHDCETLLVHPKTGEVFLVTKEASGQSSVYAFPLPLKPNEVVTLKKVAKQTFVSTLLTGRLADGERMATGGDISPNGKHLLIRTYLWAYEWDIAPKQPLAEIFSRKPRQYLLPLTKQGEAICYRADGLAWLITSEGVHTPLYELTK